MMGSVCRVYHYVLVCRGEKGSKDNTPEPVSRTRSSSPPSTSPTRPEDNKATIAKPEEAKVARYVRMTDEPV